MTIETLSEGIVKATDKYVYSGQSHHSLAYAYYTNNYDKKDIRHLLTAAIRHTNQQSMYELAVLGLL